MPLILVSTLNGRGDFCVTSGDGFIQLFGFRIK